MRQKKKTLFETFESNSWQQHCYILSPPSHLTAGWPSPSRTETAATDASYLVRIAGPSWSHHSSESEVRAEKESREGKGVMEEEEEEEERKRRRRR